MDLELLEKRLNIMFNTWEIDHIGNFIAKRELIGKIDKLKLYIYSNDHNPPHFHIMSSNINAYLDLKTCELIKGTVDGKSLKKLKYWHESEYENLINAWNRLNETKLIKL